MTGLIILSCGGSKQLRIENWYQLSIDSIHTNRKLIKVVYYDKNDNKKKEIDYNPSETIFQKVTEFDSKGNKTSEFTYFDSTKSIGYKIQYYYNDKALSKVIAIGLNGKEKDNKTIMTYQREVDSLNRLSKLMTINDNDTIITEYRYNDFNKSRFI